MKKDIIIPAAGESVTEADIVGWHKASGDFVEMDEPIVELETDKASMDLTAETSGILTISVEEGTVKVGDVIGHIEESDAKPDTPKEEAPAEKPAEITPPTTTEPTPKPTKSESYASGHPSPAAEKLIQEKGLSKEAITGTGKDGRITKQDAKATQPSQQAPKTESKKEEKADIPTPSIDPKQRQTRLEKMSRLRKTLMTRLVDSQQTTASLTTFNEVDMYEVMNIRKKYKDDFKEKHGIGLGFMSFFTKAVTVALQNFPIINATIEDEEIKYHDYCDIGIAVATPKGLIVPVVRNAESLNFQEIEAQIRRYGQRP